MKAKKTMKGRGEEPLTKLEVLDKYPKIAAALQDYVAEKQAGGRMMMGGRMMGGGWWSDFVDWLKRNKVISIASKVGSVIAGAVGAAPLSVALGAVSTGSSALGYGYVNNLSKLGTKRMMTKGMGMNNSMMGKGPIYSQNGMLVQQPKQSGGRSCMCGGATTQYNTVSTEFSEVKFR